MLMQQGQAIQEHSTSPQAIEEQAFNLRDNTTFHLIQPGALTSRQLSQPGSYLCVMFAGDMNLYNTTENSTRSLSVGKLHILRQTANTGRELHFSGEANLGFVVYFSPEWIRACPQGPTCKIGQFLVKGMSKSPDQNHGQGPTDQALPLTPQGEVISRQMLSLGPDNELAILNIEMAVLSLLSWAYSAATLQNETTKTTPTLPIRHKMKIRQTAEMIRQQPHDPPTIDELSKAIGMNSSDLKKGFRLLYDTSIARYSRKFRLEMARDLLENSSLSIAHIALEIGFANPSQFARAFRQQFGQNPSDLR